MIGVITQGYGTGTAIAQGYGGRTAPPPPPLLGVPGIITQGYGTALVVLQGYGGIIPPTPKPKPPPPSSGAGGSWPYKKPKKVTPAIMAARFRRLRLGLPVSDTVRHDWRYYLRQLDTYLCVFQLPLQLAEEAALVETCNMRNGLNEIMPMEGE